MTRSKKWRVLLACGRVCATAVVGTLLHAESSNAVAGVTFGLRDGASIIGPVARVNHDSTRAAGESYPILLGRADDRQARSGGDVPVPTDGAQLPANLVVSPKLQPLLLRMWKHSQTFRRQCARLRAEPRLLVRVYTAASVSQSGLRAATHIDRGGSGLEAAVYLATRDGARDLIELIAHEIEHIIEQLDRLDLPRLARLSPKTVWSTGSQLFETRRATYTGRVVAAEVKGRVE